MDTGGDILDRWCAIIGAGKSTTTDKKEPKCWQEAYREIHQGRKIRHRPRIYTGELGRYEASEKHNININTARDYMRQYEMLMTLPQNEEHQKTMWLYSRRLSRQSGRAWIHEQILTGALAHVHLVLLLILYQQR